MPRQVRNHANPPKPVIQSHQFAHLRPRYPPLRNKVENQSHPPYTLSVPCVCGSDLRLNELSVIFAPNGTLRTTKQKGTFVRTSASGMEHLMPFPTHPRPSVDVIRIQWFQFKLRLRIPRLRWGCTSCICPIQLPSLSRPSTRHQ